MNVQSILSPAGPQAATIEQLWWIFLIVTAAVFVAVAAAVLGAMFRRHADRPVSERTVTRAVAVAVGLTVVTLIGLITVDAFSARRLSSLETDDRLVIDITGRQWWWDIEYQDPDPSMRVRSANELRLPVGRVVQINLRSADVIHSFWVPALHGKRDLVPGHLNELWVKADQPGTYRGQCAEFCGLQHAHMALTVIVEPQDAFSKWITAQRELTPTNPTDLAARGRLIVEHGPCSTCHTVRGTTAGGRVGPDLTHVAARTTIAAGALPMSRDNRRRWIEDPQHLKPGVRMPALGLSREELDAVVAYLGGSGER
jgi:cytochrome c oxidase subunit 2